MQIPERTERARDEYLDGFKEPGTTRAPREVSRGGGV